MDVDDIAIELSKKDYSELKEWLEDLPVEAIDLLRESFDILS